MKNKKALPGYASFKDKGDTYIVWAPAVTALRSIPPTTFNPEGETAVYSGPHEMMIVPLPVGQVHEMIQRAKRGYEEWKIRKKVMIAQEVGQSS